MNREHELGKGDSCGPYQSERDTWSELLPARVRKELHSRLGQDLTGLSYDISLSHLLASCESAGIELGAFDRSVLDWLAGWEPSTVQVVIGLVARAYAAGVAGHGRLVNGDPCLRGGEYSVESST
jgi:hypothetical protein